MKKKLFTILAVLLTLTLTSCSDFWNWVEEVEDESETFYYYTGSIDNQTYEYLFTYYGFGTKLSGNYYSQKNDNFKELGDNLKGGQSLCVRKWSQIEENLRALGYSSSECWEMENKLKSEKAIIYVERRSENGYHRWFYISHAQDR